MNQTFPLRHRWLLAVIVPAILLLSAFGCRPTNTNTNTPTTNETTNTSVNPINTTGDATANANLIGAPIPTQRSATEQELTRLASAFAERYGSYSNQTDFENLESLYVFMTASLEKATQTFVAAERAKHRDTSIYYGITARAVTVTVRSLDENKGTASFLVTTFRKETIGSNGNTTSFQQDVLIDMKKDGSAWKIDQATWQRKS